MARLPDESVRLSDAERWGRVRSLFDLAADQPQDQWDAIVAREGAGDVALQEEVHRLLAAARDDILHLDRPDLLVGDIDAVQRVGAMVSHYRLTRLIGQGGMGDVFEAVRADGEFEQRVAIKFIRHELLGGGVAARFHRERQLLAGLEHPNIARLVDGGSTADGEPIFVMEYVDGTRLTEYCDAHRLSLHDRLRLFQQVLGAVEHAHGKLIVHRDLKPDNMLVTASDLVKLLDFGVAKLLRDDAGGELTTIASVRAITPEYASPEQLRNEPDSTAGDVYALGVVLYELLAGRRPFDVPNRSPVLALRAAEHEVARASALVTDAAARARGLASAAQLRRQLAGELDHVLAKAVRFDPERRYRSVEQLSEDVRCFLAGRPVSAQPDSFGYRTRKFIRRHRAATIAGAIVLVTVVGGTLVAIAQARRANAELVWELAANSTGNLDELGVEHLAHGDLRGADSLLNLAVMLCNTYSPSRQLPLPCARSLYDGGIARLWKGDPAGAERWLRQVLAMVRAATPAGAVPTPELEVASAKLLAGWRAPAIIRAISLGRCNCSHNRRISFTGPTRMMRRSGSRRWAGAPSPANGRAISPERIHWRASR